MVMTSAFTSVVESKVTSSLDRGRWLATRDVSGGGGGSSPTAFNWSVEDVIAFFLARSLHRVSRDVSSGKAPCASSHLSFWLRSISCWMSRFFRLRKPLRTWHLNWWRQRNYEPISEQITHLITAVARLYSRGRDVTDGLRRECPCTIHARLVKGEIKFKITRDMSEPFASTAGFNQLSYK